MALAPDDDVLAHGEPVNAQGMPVLALAEPSPAPTDLFNDQNSPDAAGVMDARAGGVSHARPKPQQEQSMEKQQQYRGEAFHREAQFMDAHPDVFALVNSSDARKSLDTALTKLDFAVDVQLTRIREAKGEMHDQEVLERTLRDRHMTPVSRVALGKLAGTPKIKALTPSASKLKGARLVKAARAMARAATPYVAEFTAATFPADFAQQLLDAADAVQASIYARRRKNADRKNATSSVEEALKEARAAALQLEGMIGRLVPRGTPLHDEWMSVRRVVNVAVRSKKAATAAAPQAQEGAAAKIA